MVSYWFYTIVLWLTIRGNLLVYVATNKLSWMLNWLMLFQAAGIVSSYCVMSLCMKCVWSYLNPSIQQVSDHSGLLRTWFYFVVLETFNAREDWDSRLLILVRIQVLLVTLWSHLSLFNQIGMTCVVLVYLKILLSTLAYGYPCNFVVFYLLLICIIRYLSYK